MRISIYDKEEDRRIRFYVPNSLLAARWIWRLAEKYGGQGKGKNAFPLTPEQIRSLAVSLKQYVRRNGHFDLVNVESADGDRVHIRV